MNAEREEVSLLACNEYEVVTEKVKIEEQETRGPALSESPKRSRKTSHPVQIGKIGERLSWVAAKRAEHELNNGLLSQCPDFLKTIQVPYSGWRSPQRSRTPFPSPLGTPAGKSHGPDEEVTSRGLQSSPSTDCGEKAGDDNGKGDVSQEEDLTVEMQRQRFRWFCYQEAEEPRQICAQLRELCLQWLQPDLNSKEQMVDLIVLEQFLAILPEEIQSWVGDAGPETCAQAVDLVEEFLLRQQETERWKQEVLGEFEEVAMSFSREDDAGEGQLSREIKRETVTLLDNEWETEEEGSSFDPSLERVEPRDPGENVEDQGRPGWEQRVQIDQRRSKPMLYENGGPDGIDLQQRMYAVKRRHICNICGKAFTQKSNLNRHQRTHVGEKRFHCFKCGKSFNWETSFIRHQQFHTGEKPYPCLDCGKRFSRTANLIIHRRIHTGEKPHQCLDCGQSFSQISNLVRHHRVHTGEKPYKCTECEKSFTQKSNLIKHQSIHSSDRPNTSSDFGRRLNQRPSQNGFDEIPLGESPCICFKCGKTFSRRGNLLRHQTIHTKDKPHKCTECGKRFNQRTNLNAHQRIHTGEKPYRCPDCSKSFRWRAHLIIHKRLHTGEKPHRCADCGQSFSQRSNLVRHQRTHTGEKPFQCTDCEKSFGQKSNLIKHQRIHAGENEFRQSLNGVSQDQVLLEEEPYKCFRCGKVFSRRGNLLRHQSIHTREKPHKCPDCGKRFNQRTNLISHQRIHTGEKPFQCPECGKSFRQSPHLIKHMKVHTEEKALYGSLDYEGNVHPELNHERTTMGGKSYECLKCGKVFNWQSNFIRHQKIHAGEEPHECAECGEKFNRQKNLIAHQRIHMREKPYTCTECGQNFMWEAHLVIHQRIHTGEKPHMCSECGQSFSQRSNLIRHQRIHTGEKPYKCSECGQSFSQRTHLVVHERIHTGEKPHRCQDCGQGFSQRAHLIVHQRIHTGEKPHRCMDCGQGFCQRSNLLRHRRTHACEKTKKQQRKGRKPRQKSPFSQMEVKMKVKMEVKETTAGSPPPLGLPNEPRDSLQAESSRDRLYKFVPKVKSEPEEGEVKPWVGQWTDLREAGEPSCSAWGSVPPPEVRSVACETRLKEEPPSPPPSPGVKAEEPEACLDEKNDDLSDEDLEVDLQRQRFRNFLYKEAEGPRAAYLQLEELCYGWLQPDMRSKEEILELLILEQFLTVLPPDMESWVRARGPESCDWAVELAEDFLQWQQEADEWGEQDIGRVEEVSSTFSQSGQTLLDTKEKTPGGAKKRKRDTGSNMLQGDQRMKEEMEESQGAVFSEDEDDGEIFIRPEGVVGPFGGRKQEWKTQDEICKVTIPNDTPPGTQGKPCPVCGKCFNRLSHLKRHVAIHTGERPYKCSICGKGFTQKTNLAAHEAVHREGICSDCGKSFKLKWGLTTHPMGEMWYKCRPCKRIYELSRPRPPVNASGEGMEGSSNQLAENEVEEWMCRSLKVPGGVLCKVKASSKIPGTYKGKKQSPCHVCGKVFATRSSLNRHQRIHTGEKPYICSICGKSFNQKTSLLTHSFIHSEHKPYQCSECGKSFRHSTGLLVHQRMHTGEKPYKCSICQKHFSQSSHVVKHISRKHAKEKELLSAAFASTAEAQLYTTTVESQLFTTTAQAQLFTSPPETQLFTSTAENQLFTSTAETKLFTSPPENKLFTSPSENKLFTSPSENKLFTSPPETQLFASTAETKLFTSRPETQLFNSTAETRLFTSPPETQLFTSRAEAQL